MRSIHHHRPSHFCVLYVLTADFCPWGEIPCCQAVFSSPEMDSTSLRSQDGSDPLLPQTKLAIRETFTLLPPLTGMLRAHVGHRGDEDKTDFKKCVCVDVMDITCCHVVTYDLTSGLWCIQWLDNCGWIVKVAQSCPTLCNPVDSTVHGILQARILEWVPFHSPDDLPNPGIEPGLPHCKQILYQLSQQGSPWLDNIISFQLYVIVAKEKGVNCFLEM